MSIAYKVNIPLSVKEIIEVYASSGINRPVEDEGRIGKMYNHSNLVVSAWEGEQLVAVCRALTDFCYCCYVSDLAVRKEYQRKGIGKELLRITKENIGEQSMLLLLSAAPAMEYYPKMGMQKVENGFIIKRVK